MRIVSETLRPGCELEYCDKPTNLAAANFIAVEADEVIVTRRAADLFKLPDDTPVIANWRGERRNDAFPTNVAELKSKAHAFGVVA
jgi:hypothetical protein